MNKSCRFYRLSHCTTQFIPTRVFFLLYNYATEQSNFAADFEVSLHCHECAPVLLLLLISFYSFWKWGFYVFIFFSREVILNICYWSGLMRELTDITNLQSIIIFILLRILVFICWLERIRPWKLILKNAKAKFSSVYIGTPSVHSREKYSWSVLMTLMRACGLFFNLFTKYPCAFRGTCNSSSAEENSDQIDEKFLVFASVSWM